MQPSCTPIIRYSVLIIVFGVRENALKIVLNILPFYLISGGKCLPPGAVGQLLNRGVAILRLAKASLAAPIFESQFETHFTKLSPSKLQVHHHTLLSCRLQRNYFVSLSFPSFVPLGSHGQVLLYRQIIIFPYKFMYCVGIGKRLHQRQNSYFYLKDTRNLDFKSAFV